jgi:hypothetical protein
MKLKRATCSTGHGTGRLVRRDLHDILADSDTKRRKLARWAKRVNQGLKLRVKLPPVQRIEHPAAPKAGFFGKLKSAARNLFRGVR